MDDNAEQVTDCLCSPATRKVLDELKEEVDQNEQNKEPEETSKKKGRNSARP